MSRRAVSAALALACFIASLLVGLTKASKGDSSESPGGSTFEGIVSTLWSQASDVAGLLCEKMSELAGSPDPMLVLVGAGAATATVVICTLYGLSRYFDSEPYLFNDGKLGKLEAKSIYNDGKKKC